MSTTTIEQPYRIGTTYKTRPSDGRPQIIATTHGPVRSARLTHNVNLRLSATANHEAAALALATKMSGTRLARTSDTVSVREHSSNDAGTRRDFAVFIEMQTGASE